MSETYKEFFRPQFHFSPKKGWTNDPNGLVYYDGVYHLFFQHNPFGVKWGNMTWGHAVSSDLVHWQQLDHAIHPDELGTIFSGSAAVDHENTGGFKDGEHEPLIAMYTSAGDPFTQSIAYSTDSGRTWTKYANNPVIEHVVGKNRDPKLVWHAPSRKWIVPLYLTANEYGFFGSADLKKWELLSRYTLQGASECPDLFPLAVDGKSNEKKWVFWGANGTYQVGSFDGERFSPETEPRKVEQGANGYAAQTWSDIPEEDGRRIQISWMAGGKYPDMPFNQQMSFPVELFLRSGPGGPRLCRRPVKELEHLRADKKEWTNLAPGPEKQFTPDTDHDLLEILMEIEVPDDICITAPDGKPGSLLLNIRGTELRYDPGMKTVELMEKKAPLAPVNGVVTLHILVDRTSIEVFGNDGELSMSFCFLPGPYDHVLQLQNKSTATKVRKLTVIELKSIWN